MKLNRLITKGSILIAILASGSGIVHSQTIDAKRPLALGSTSEFSKKIHVFPSLTSGIKQQKFGN